MAVASSSLNFFPENISHIHLMGICGTGMAALAGMLQSKGFRVTGSDNNVYPPMSDFLAGLGLTVQSGYDPANLEPRPDLVVVGNVIPKANPEAVAMVEAAIAYVSLPQALGHFFLSDKKSLVVAGTHGKTTTSSMLATMLHGAGSDPGFMIGGIVQAFARNFRIGHGSYFVVEGDEYDTAYFDKGPKFLHYQPWLAIITSIEFDHADIYADLEAIKESFRRLVAIMPADGCIIACFDDPVVREIVRDAPCQVMSYGQGEGLDWVLDDLSVSPAGTSFAVLRSGDYYHDFTSKMPGRHNGLNSLAVIAAMAHLGLTAETISRELLAFAGVKRRQEVRGEVGGVTVIDDFAHHPTAVRETLAALAAAYAGRRLVAVFEARTNSSRRRIFQEDYARVFDHADLVVVKEPEAIAGLAPADRFSADELVRDLAARGRTSNYFADTDEVLSFLGDELIPGDVVAILSNGGFDNIHVRLLDLLVDRL